MSLARIVWRNIAQRGLSSALTALSIALGTALVVTILSLERQAREKFNEGAVPFELIVGARGSATQLVLNTVYHLDQSPGNIPFEVYEELRADRQLVRVAAPIAVGDAYRGFRVVGTSDTLLTEVLGVEVEGRVFTYSDEKLRRALAGEETDTFEAVAGATAAREAGLAVGSTFEPAHGIEGGAAHAETWTVVGVLRPTGTPADRAIYINIDSFFSIREHESASQISAVVVATRGKGQAVMLDGKLKGRPDVMAVNPGRVVGDLFEQLAPIGPMMLTIAAFVVVVAGISIMVSIYNSMAERRREIAVLRALGARRGTILRIILCEATFLCLSGGLMGVALGHALLAAAAPALQESAGFQVSAWDPQWVEAQLLACLCALGLVAGIVPALRGMRVEVADGLAG